MSNQPRANEYETGPRDEQIGGSRMVSKLTEIAVVETHGDYRLERVGQKFLQASIHWLRHLTLGVLLPATRLPAGWMST